jgi:exoribonuclease R
MKEKVGMEFSGMIVSAKSSGVIVRLNEIPVSAILKKTSLAQDSGNTTIMR